jgi:hypothetical protein
MRRALSLFCMLSLLAATSAPAASAGTVAVSGPASALTLRLLPLDGAVHTDAGGDAFVHVGSVSAHPAPGRKSAPILVRQSVGLRLDGQYASARVSVALAVETPGCVVRVDGLSLSTVPRMINPVHRVGATVVHEIEMTIPASVPAGAFLSNLQWFAETD